MNGSTMPKTFPKVRLPLSCQICRLDAASHISMDRQLTATGVHAPALPHSSSAQNVDSALPVSPDRGKSHDVRNSFPHVATAKAV